MLIFISGRGALARARLPHGVLLSLLLAAAPLSHSAETPSFTTLLQLSQSRAPQLLEQSANTRAAAADAQQARAWSNPSLSATAENLSAPKSAGQSQRQDTYTLTQVFEIGGKRTARIEAEARKADAAGNREKLARVQFTNELAVAYATAEAMQLRQEVAVAEATRAQDDLRAAQALVKAGREADLRVAQAQASFATAQATVQSSGAAAIEALELLSAMVGATESFIRIDHPFLTTIPAAPYQPGWLPDQSPALASALSERDAMQAQVRVEEKRWIPDVGVSVGMRKFDWSSEKAAVVGVTLNIPLFDRNQSGTSAAKERATSAAMRAEAVRLGTVAQHRSAVAQVTATQRSLQAAELAERAASEAYRLGRVGYDAGKTSLAELLAIRRALSDAKNLTIEAQLARVRAIATLSMAEGRNAFGETP